MARGSRSRQRDDFSIPSDPLLSDPIADALSPLAPPIRPAIVPELPDLYDWIELEDRRLFHPAGEGLAPAIRSPGSPSRISHSRGFFFERPSSEVLICARRKERREVLFAKRRTGGGGGRRRRRNFWSDVRC